MQTWLQKKKEKRGKRKRKDDKMLIRSNLTYFNLIFCSPEWTEENKAITSRDKKKLNSEVRVGQNDFPSKFGKLELVFFTKKQSLES